MTDNKYNTVRIFPKYNRKIVERDQINFPIMYDRSHSWLGTGSSIKSGWVILDVWA